MSTPMSAASFLTALKSEGVEVVEVGNWETHNRNTKGPWGPVNGVMIHHTVTKGTQNTIDIVNKGYSALPGPLCHGMIAKSGKVYLVGYGRANHAGLGDPDVLAAIIAERTPPLDNEATIDGNRHFYGFECENLGDNQDEWPAVQIDAIVKVITAICREHGWSARSALRHLDWQPGKVDPRGPGMDWASVLSKVAARLGQTAPTKPLPAPPVKPKVDLSKLIEAAKANPSANNEKVTYAGVKIVEAALVNEGLLSKTYSDGHYGTTTIAAYAAWQRRCNYTGKAADGIPGKDSLQKLADKHGFTVVD